MTKQTAPLNSSREIELPCQISLNSETAGIFYEFLGDGYSVKIENEILEKSRRMYIFKEYSIMINEIKTGTK